MSLLTPEQAAEHLGVSVRTLRRWEVANRLVPQRTVGNHRRYELSDLDALVAAVRKQNKKYFVSTNEISTTL